MFSLRVGQAELLVDQKDDHTKLTFCGYQPQSVEIEGTLANFSLDYFKEDASYVVTALSSNVIDGYYHDFYLHAWLLDTKANTVNYITRTIDGEYIVPADHLYFTVELVEKTMMLELRAKNLQNGQENVIQAFNLAR